MNQYGISVKGIVEYKDRYLIVERWFDDRIVDPYQWGFLDDKIEFGEAPEKEVLRIAADMTGLSVHMKQALYTWSYMVGEVFNIGIAYLLQADSDEVILSEELNDYKWVKKEELGQYIENSMILKDVETYL